MVTGERNSECQRCKLLASKCLKTRKQSKTGPVGKHGRVLGIITNRMVTKLPHGKSSRNACKMYKLLNL